jgi:LysR family transcriptional activator of nhaA
MNQLNYHHLYYFWSVAKMGSITAATKKLKLSQPTISGQIRRLELSIGQKLFVKRGRGIELSQKGKVVLKYADKIFSVGEELLQDLSGNIKQAEIKFHVGVAMVIPKLVTYRLLKVIMDNQYVPICIEDSLENLLARLSLGELDVVLSDSPIPPMVNIKAYNHLLVDCGVSFCASKKYVKKYQNNFPTSLNHAPFLIPTEGTTLRRSLMQWFEKIKVTPKIIAEFHDSALLKVFGQHGHGIFAVPTMIEKDVVNQYDVHVVGRVEEIRESFYAISLEKNIRQPALKTITKQVRYNEEK